MWPLPDAQIRDCCDDSPATEPENSGFPRDSHHSTILRLA